MWGGERNISPAGSEGTGKEAIVERGFAELRQ